MKDHQVGLNGQLPLTGSCVHAEDSDLEPLALKYQKVLGAAGCPQLPNCNLLHSETRATPQGLPDPLLWTCQQGKASAMFPLMPCSRNGWVLTQKCHPEA